MTELAPNERLERIAELLPECSPPDIANGYDLCSCGRGDAWPCPITQASWYARGIDPDAEVRRACREAASAAEAAYYAEYGCEST